MSERQELHGSFPALLQINYGETGSNFESWRLFDFWEAPTWILLAASVQMQSCSFNESKVYLNGVHTIYARLDHNMD